MSSHPLCIETETTSGCVELSNVCGSLDCYDAYAQAKETEEGKGRERTWRRSGTNSPFLSLFSHFLPFSLPPSLPLPLSPSFFHVNFVLNMLCRLTFRASDLSVFVSPQQSATVDCSPSHSPSQPLPWLERVPCFRTH